ARQLTELGRDALAECAGASGALHVVREPVEALTAAIKRFRLAMEPMSARGAFVQLVARTEVRDELDRLKDTLDDLAGVLAAQADRSRGLGNVHERAETLSACLDRIDTHVTD